MNWLILAFRANRRVPQKPDRLHGDVSEDVSILSNATNLAFATGILRILLDKNYIDLKDASAVCRFVSDTLADVQVSPERASVQAAVWKELSNAFERKHAYQ